MNRGYLVSSYAAALSVLLLVVFSNSSAQIIVNGRNPARYSPNDLQHSITVSYGNIFWVDGKHVPLSGSSSSMQQLREPYSVENFNSSLAASIGYERTISEKMALRVAFSTAKLTTGLQSRADLKTTDRSRITQLGAYSRYRLTKSSARRFQAQWLAGPELIFVKKDVLIDDYVDGKGDPDLYRQRISILEGALVTGVGLSFRLSDAFSIFSDGLVGIALPGKGLKVTNSGLGIKYHW